MAKLVFFAAVIAALVAISVAADRVAVPASSTQCQCQRELQESSLGACQQFVDQQLNMVPVIPWIAEERKMWCCQNLQHISSGCRAAAIRSIVRKYEQDLEAAQQPQMGGPRYPVSGEPAEQQPQQEGGQEQHGCPAQRTQTVVRQQPVGGLLPVGLPEEIARERLTRARQLVAQLPAQCGLECGAFSPGHY